MKRQIKIDRGQEKIIAEEERYLWTRWVLQNETLNLPLEDCLPESLDLKDFTVEYKNNLRNVLLKFDIRIVEELGGDTFITVGNTEIARWKKPYFELRSDSARHARPYVLLYLQHDSVFDPA